jgi:sulfite exporter TauE/SafE
MNSSLLLTAGLMGLVGGPHCLAMCGAPCLGISRWTPERPLHSLLWFQAGRLLGYASLGAVAAASMSSLAWLSVQSAAFRPLWTMVHVMAVLLGLLLMWRANQPLWLNETAQRLWQRVASPARRQAFLQHPWGAMLLGMAWALLPCGLLYSALMVALFSGGPGQGALVMICFALGGGVMLTVGPLFWLKLQQHHAVSQRWSNLGTRLAGLTLSATAAWGLWLGLVHDQAPWCVQAPV